MNSNKKIYSDNNIINIDELIAIIKKYHYHQKNKAGEEKSPPALF